MTTKKKSGFVYTALVIALAFSWAMTRTMEGTIGFVASIGAFLVVFGVLQLVHFRGWKDAFRIHINECEAHAQEIKKQVVEVGEKGAASAITMAEQNVLDALNRCGADFDALGESHDGEQSAFRDHIHSAMALIYARVGLRSSVQYQLLRDLSKTY